MNVNIFIWKNYVVLVIRIYLSGNTCIFGNWILIAIGCHRDNNLCDRIN